MKSLIAFLFVVAWPMIAQTREVTRPHHSVIRKIVRMKVTAYCPCAKCCGSRACDLTATGRRASTTYGVAADFRLLPPGTELFIPGIGERRVDDTGRDMRWDARYRGITHIDVRMHSHWRAKLFGVQSLDVIVEQPT